MINEETEEEFSPEDLSALESRHAEFALAQFTRRQALRKIGITASASLLVLFNIDDITRFTVAKLQEHKDTQWVAGAVTKELRDLGVAYGQGVEPCGCGCTTGDCICCCECTYTRTIAAMCTAAPLCCTNGLPNGNLFCPFFNYNVAVARTTETNCIAGC